MKKNLEYNLIIILINSDKLFFTQIFSWGRWRFAQGIKLLLSVLPFPLFSCVSVGFFISLEMPVKVGWLLKLFEPWELDGPSFRKVCTTMTLVLYEGSVVLDTVERILLQEKGPKDTIGDVNVSIQGGRTDSLEGNTLVVKVTRLPLFKNSNQNPRRNNDEQLTG
jgi:hypothetical protein